MHKGHEWMEYVARCKCGWESLPAKHPESLEWVDCVDEQTDRGED